MQIKVKLDDRALRKALRQAPKAVGQKAVAAAINRTAAMARTQLKRDIATQGKLPQKLVTPGLPVKKATPGKPEATIIPTGKRISLTKLGAKQTRAGVRAGKHFRKSAFIPKSTSRQWPVFKRAGRSRLPVIKQTVPGVRAIASRKVIADTIRKFIELKLVERVNHEIKFRMRKLGL